MGLKTCFTNRFFSNKIKGGGDLRVHARFFIPALCEHDLAWINCTPNREIKEMGHNYLILEQLPLLCFLTLVAGLNVE